MGLVDRVKAVLLTPQKEWPVIEAESATPASLYTGYILPLAAIGPVAQFIGLTVFGLSLGLLGSIKVPVGTALGIALAMYVGNLVGVFVLALIIDALAQSFDGQKSQIQALKLAAYSWTASWVAGIFMIFPALSILSIVGLYSLFLLYLGLPVMMKVSKEKSMPYIIVVIIAAVVIYFVIGVIVAQLTPWGRMATGGL